MTISHLELLAVLIGVRAANFVARELRLNIREKILWTDSQCVLHWLRTKKPLSTINKSSLWWHGPSWLETNRLLWPVWNSSEITPENLQHLEAEFNRSKSFTEGAHVAVDKLNEKEVLLFGIQKPLCSSLRRLLCIYVYVLRLLQKKVWNKLDGEKTEQFNQHKLLTTICESLSDAYITMHEIKLVSLLWIYTIQCHHYIDVFIALKNNKRNCLQKQLGLQEDEYGILRCHGRYANAHIGEETKFPKLLPRRNYFTQLLILEVHGRLVHAGISHTLSQLRQEYWKGRG